jgi:hypothetical protein
VWLRFVEHLYSIWKKMQGKGLDFTRVFDLRAMRVVMADVPEDLGGAAEADPGVVVTAAEDHALLTAALEAVSAPCQALLRLLIADPPLSYDDISAVLDMPRAASAPPGSGV